MDIITRLLFACIFVFLVSCSKAEPDNPPSPPKPSVVEVQGVTLDKASAEMYVGESLTLVATVSPSNATNKNISWSSGNTAVATVNNGLVTAVAPGEATIIVTTEDGGKIATCIVRVKAKTVAVTGVMLSAIATEMFTGQTLKLTAMVLPSNATNKNVVWSSSNAAVVTVQNGTVTAVAPGEATITVVTEDGEKNASCKVVVKPVDNSVGVDNWGEGWNNEGTAS